MKPETVHILLVEDNEVDVEAMQRALKKQRILNPVHVACDGRVALDMLLAGEVPRPYIILLDLNMPRMNGVEFLEVMRASDPIKNSVVFVLTTSKDERDIVASYDHCVAGYMVKSQLGEDFLRLVELLDRYWRVVELPNTPA